MKYFPRKTQFLQHDLILVVLTLGLLLSFSTQRSDAQSTLNVWSTHGPGGEVSRVIADPKSSNIVYAWGPGGVFKSLNYGESWGATTINPGYDLGDLAVDPIHSNTLYLGRSSGLYKTVNGATTWFAAYSPGVSIGAVTVAPSDSNIIYAASGDFSALMFVSTNGGDTWITRPLPATFVGAWFLAVDPHNPLVIYTYLNGYDDILLLKTIDGGISWTPLAYAGGLFWDTYSFNIDPINSNIIYAATERGVYKSIDAGITWTLRSPQGLPVLSVARDPVNSNTLYIGFGGGGPGVYKSTDDGATWSAFNTGLTNFNVFRLAFDSSGRFLYAATQGGVFSVRVRRAAWVNTGEEN